MPIIYYYQVHPYSFDFHACFQDKQSEYQNPNIILQRTGYNGAFANIGDVKQI